MSLIRYAEHRNRADLIAFIYGLSIALTVTALNGLAGAVLWSDTLFWSTYAHTALPPIATGLALLFLRDLYAVSARHRRYDVLLFSTGWLVIASTLSLSLLDRADAHLFIATVTFLGALVGLKGSQLSWRFRSAIGRLIFTSYTLQFLAVIRLIAESWGLISVSWADRYLTSLAIALSMPLLLYALRRATHVRKVLTVPAHHLHNQDALTGLLTRQAFMAQYEAAYAQVIHGGEPIAVVLIRVINHSHIRQAFGDTTAEQC